MLIIQMYKFLMNINRNCILKIKICGTKFAVTVQTFVANTYIQNKFWLTQIDMNV